ncbi:histidine phosphatase family protein, partial [Mesorhizobium sp. M0938]
AACWAPVLAMSGLAMGGKNSVWDLAQNPGLVKAPRRRAGPGSDAEALKKLEEKYPTAALARFAFDGSWARLALGDARLTHCVWPKDLR